MTTHPLLELRDLRFTYPDGRRAVDGLSLSFAEGGTIGIVGPNGAGKSTLLHLMLGVLTPQSGVIALDGVAVTPKTLPELRRRLGLAFQNPDDQLFMPTVGEDVAFGPRNQGLDEAEALRRAEEALEQVGLGHVRDRSPFKLSGGEKRAAAIAAVLAMRPDILILDEPTSALDPRSRRRMMELLAGFDHTKIMTSHDLDMVKTLCERVIVMKGGKAAADGPARDVLSDIALLEACGLQ